MVKILKLTPVTVIFSLLLSTGAYALPETTSRFIDNDTFEIISYGKAADSAKGIRAKMQACGAARLVGQSAALDELTNASKEALKVNKNIEIKDKLNKTTVKEISGVVKKWKVVDQEFEESTNTCKLTSHIVEKDLKKRIQK